MARDGKRVQRDMAHLGVVDVVSALRRRVFELHLAILADGVHLVFVEGTLAQRIAKRIH